MARADATTGLAAASAGAGDQGRQRTMRKGRKHLQRAQDYIAAGRWLFRDFFRFMGARGIRVLISGGLQIGTKFASVAVLYAFVDALTKGYPPELAGWHLPAPDTAGFLVAGTVAAMGLLTLSTLFRYDVRQRGIKLGRGYEEHCARRVVALASLLPDPRTPEANRTVLLEPMHLFVGYCKNCGMAARELTQLLPTFGSFLVGCVVLIVLDAGTTAALALMALLAFAAQYPANHRAAQASRSWEKHRMDANRRLVDIFAHLRRAPVPLAPNGPVLDQLFADGPVRANIDSFANRTLGSEQASLVSRVGSHLLLGGALLLLGSDLITGHSSWAAVAVYVTAVRFTLADFVVVSKLATGITRFHAQIHRYVQFVQWATPASLPRTAPPPAGGPTLELTLPSIRGSAPPLRLGAGDAVAIMMPWARGAPFAAAIMTAASPASLKGLTMPARVGPTLIDPMAPLRSSLAIPPGLDEGALVAALRRFAPEGALAELLAPGWLDQPAPAQGWARTLPPWLLTALHLLVARARGQNMLALDGLFLDGMSESWRAAWNELMADGIRFVIREVSETGQVFQATVGRLGAHGERALLLADDKSLVGWLALEGQDGLLPELRTFFQRVFQRRLVDTTEDETDEAEDAA